MRVLKFAFEQFLAMEQRKLDFIKASMMEKVDFNSLFRSPHDPKAPIARTGAPLNEPSPIDLKKVKKLLKDDSEEMRAFMNLNLESVSDNDKGRDEKNGQAANQASPASSSLTEGERIITDQTADQAVRLALPAPFDFIDDQRAFDRIYKVKKQGSAEQRIEDSVQHHQGLYRTPKERFLACVSKYVISRPLKELRKIGLK